MPDQYPRFSWITWTPKAGSVSSRALQVGWSPRDLLAMYGQVLERNDDGTLSVQAYFQGPVRLEPPTAVTLSAAECVAMGAHPVDTPESRRSDGRYLHPVYAPDDIVEP